MQASSVVIKNKCHLRVALQSLVDFSELLIRLELTDADAPVGLYLHSSPNPSFVKGGALEVASSTNPINDKKQVPPVGRHLLFVSC